MIKCFLFENFKSFEKAEWNIEALTTLIGTNASGKSNAIEGIRILSELVAVRAVQGLKQIPLNWVVWWHIARNRICCMK